MFDMYIVIGMMSAMNVRFLRYSVMHSYKSCIVLALVWILDTDTSTFGNYVLLLVGVIELAQSLCITVQLLCWWYLECAIYENAGKYAYDGLTRVHSKIWDLYS